MCNMCATFQRWHTSSGCKCNVHQKGARVAGRLEVAAQRGWLLHNAQCTTTQLNMAQCTMHSCTWHIFWVQHVQQLDHHTMCSFLSLLGILLVQCNPWRFLVLCICNVQLIFISPSVLRLTFTACSISWLHLICKGTFCYVLVQPELLCATFIVLSVLRLSLTLYCVP